MVVQADRRWKEGEEIRVIVLKFSTCILSPHTAEYWAFAAKRDFVQVRPLDRA